MRRPPSLLLLALAGVLPWSGCAGDAPLAERLDACGLVGEGELGPTITSGLYAPDACYRDCLASASCEELGEAVCRTSFDLLLRCDQRCGHHCPDGAVVSPEALCDGIPSCADGSDETGCATFRCDDGRDLSARVRCNGWHECWTGEDEEDCPRAIHRCPDGTEVEHAPDRPVRCDGLWTCGDGSDERDCAMLTPMCATP